MTKKKQTENKKENKKVKIERRNTAQATLPLLTLVPLHITPYPLPATPPSSLAPYPPTPLSPPTVYPFMLDLWHVSESFVR
jgi:hypothetical protein